MAMKSDNSLDDKGIYLEWMNDKEIIEDVLQLIYSNQGKVRYDFIVNPGYKAETQKRMSRIVIVMEEENLITRHPEEFDVLRLTADGQMAAEAGYKKYRYRKALKTLNEKAGKFILPVILVIALIIYLFLHFRKIL